MACEKGATYLDKLCHKFYDEPKGRGEKTDYVCRICGGPLEAYYCEERLYLVRCVDCGTLALVKTANPRDSARVTLARPALTPPNEWVSVEERLPGVSGNYICAVKDKNGGKWTIPAEWSLEMKMWIGAFGEIKNIVTHWMSLPAPPDRRPPEGEEGDADRG